jgi:hypothetical protein
MINSKILYLYGYIVCRPRSWEGNGDHCQSTEGRDQIDNVV